MQNAGRRSALRALGAAAVAASSGLPLHQSNAAAETRYPVEKDAQLKLLRWKRFVQGDEDVWMANTRKFTQQTGIPVQVESVNGEDLRPKAAMAANVGLGPDIVMGTSDMPQLYPDKCLDLTDVATYLGQKYGGWYDFARKYCTIKGQWISLSMAGVSFCAGLPEATGKTAGVKSKN